MELSLQFLDNESDVLDSIVVNIDTIPAHTSVSGDDLELVCMLGYSIWDENSIRIDLDWVDYSEFNTLEVGTMKLANGPMKGLVTLLE